METHIIHKVGLAVFNDKKILMARYKGNKVFYFIGGKIRAGETDFECLRRKVPDEIKTETREDTLKFLGAFHGPADGRENTFLNIKLYEGELVSEPKSAHDVEELRYFDSLDTTELSVIATQTIFPWLREQGKIN